MGRKKTNFQVDIDYLYDIYISENDFTDGEDCDKETFVHNIETYIEDMIRDKNFAQ